MSKNNTTVNQIISILEDFAPLHYQESYDNSGLQVGNRNMEINSALVCVDVTEEVIKEAIALNCKLIISHHPLIFGGIKSITGKNYVERCIIEAIKNDIAIYSCHTNLDAMQYGVSYRMAEKLGLKNIRILSPSHKTLLKLVFFVPVDHAQNVRNSIFEAGAGCIGKYDSCSFNTTGEGTFRAGNDANPFVGEIGQFHTEKELKVETVFPIHLKNKIIKTLLFSHPYEEVAYDIFSLENSVDSIGMGVVGELQEETDELVFLDKLKDVFKCNHLKHTNLQGKKVNKIALCGGSGSFLLRNAIAAGADFFVSGDFKYHDFFNAENKIVVVDIGHFESEQYTKDIFYDLLTKKIIKFAVHLSKVNTNPVKYY